MLLPCDAFSTHHFGTLRCRQEGASTPSTERLERELGSIAPGRRADVILTSDLLTLPIGVVFAHGVKVAEAGRLTVACPHYNWPEDARTTVRLGRDLPASDFAIPAPKGAEVVTARVIGIVENQAPTRTLTAELGVTEEKIEAQGEVALIALVERHRATGQVVNAFVSGFGYRVDRSA